MKKIYLILYYLWARHLPLSDSMYGFGAKHIRGFLAKRIFLYAGKHINIEHGAFFGNGSHIQIGDYSGIGVNARIQGKVTIGSHVMMAPDVMIYTKNHEISRIDIPMDQQGESLEQPVVIGNDVWIGARAIILPGVSIGDGAVIGAGSVVTKDIKPFSVVGGAPAKVIRMRNEE